MTASVADRFAALPGEQRIRLLRRLVELDRLAEIPAVVPPRAAGPVRLSPAQEDLWVHEQLYPGTPALNLCCAYHFDEPVDPADLERALAAVLAGHDALRTRITGDDLSVEFPPCDGFRLERLAGPDGTAAVRAFARRPFDLRRDPLFRGGFVTRDDGGSTLVLALHHIVTDWWSFDVLHAELAEAYRAVRAGAPPAPRRPAIQYADFAAWQRELEAAGVFAAQLRFWRGYLADPPMPLRVAAGAGSGRHGIAQVPFRVDAGTEAAVRAFARERGATVYAVLMTAFAVLAHRLTGQADLVLGTPTANRSARGTERVVGYVMNAVPTRWRIGPHDTFAGLLGRFTADFPRILANADVPVGRIVGAVEPERTPGRSPLFQWVFMHLPRQPSAGTLRAMAEPERVHTGGEHDLVGIVRDTDDGMAGTVELRTDVYPPELVRGWADSFTALLADLVATPERPVGAAALLSGAQRQRLLAGPDDTAAALPPASLADLVARHAAGSPDAVAVESDGVRLSYAGLIARADRLAARLADGGAGPERLVALALGRGVAMVVAMLAVQRAGGAYLPVDPDHPPERIRRLLADAAPVLVVTEPGSVLPDTEIPRLVLDPHGDEATYVPVPANPDAVGYVLHTSGSTGRPKGVVVTHAGIASLAAGMAGRLGLDATSRVLHLGSPSFDITVGELVMAFHPGGTLVIPPPGPLAGDALGDALRRHRITAVLVPPTVAASIPPGEYPDLSVLCLGAEACPPGLVARWATPGRRVVNAYGPTESTCAATFSDPLGPDGAVPIGRPIPNTRAYVLDARLQPVPVGVPGELYLAGSGLARGYLGQPALTAGRFVADPYAPRPGERMYRTGDLARRRPDGQLDFAGRTDEQVSLRGFRIEPAEVESALAGHDAVAGAAVLVREDTPGQQRLVAYVVPRPGARPATESLLAHAVRTLPGYLVPGAFVVLDALPATPHGKLDRAALPPPPAVDRAEFRAPATGAEQTICDLYAEVLGVDRVGVEDGFVALGGDSITAIQLVGRCRAAGLTVTVPEVFTARTPAVLAAVARAATAAVVADPGVGRFPLTPVVHWWLAHATTRDTFTMSALLRTPAGLDRERVAAALRGLAGRHGALRMRLLGHELEVPPHAAADPPLTSVDARAMTGDEVRAAARAAAAGIRLDPAAAPIVAAVWFDGGPDRPGRLLLAVHHLAVDVVSWHLLRQDLVAALTGDPAPPAAGTSVRRWSEALHRHATRVGHELPHWVRELSVPAARLAPGRAAAAGARATVTLTLPVGRTEAALTRAAAAFRCAAADVLLAALLAAAVRWRGDGSALLVMLEGHGRQHLGDDLDVSRTVGWFTTQHPVLLDAGPSGGEAFWHGGAEPGRVLGRVREQLSAAPAGGIGYGLLRHLDPDTGATLAGLPEPDLRFNYLGRRTAADDGDMELLGVVPEDGLPPAHLVELDAVVEAGSGLVASWSYPAGALTEAEVRSLAGAWFAALDVLAAAGEHRPADFPLVDLSAEQIAALDGDLSGAEPAWDDPDGVSRW